MHVSTHSRGQGHSAVAAAAYRLGATLHDERTGLTHNFAGKGGVVASAHIVPDGAAAELHDVGACWNAIEAAEKRKDSQLCRDFREAVPLGLDQAQATAMMNEWAGWLSQRYGTVVTAALHRDNALDVLGDRKADAARGYHIHALMPTRRLGPDGQFGAKLNELSNKTQSAIEIEACREQWANLCNDYAQRLSLGHTYDHRSHERRGDGLEAEITMGVEATAMTRRGLETDKAAVLRKQRVERAMQLVPEPIPAPDLASGVAPEQAIIVLSDRDVVNTFYRLRATRKDLARLQATLDQATREQDVCTATVRCYAEKEASAGQYGQGCHTRIDDAREVLRTTLPLPFWRWGRIRQAQREIITANTQHADHWTKQQAKAAEHRAYAESRLPAYEAAVEQARKKHADGVRINAGIKAAWEELTQAQQTMVQQEDAARQMRAQALERSSQEQTKEQRRERQQNMALRPAYEPYQPRQPEPRSKFGL